MQAGVLTREMLSLDALYGSAPTYLVVQTTRIETLDVRPFTERHERWLRELRSWFPGAECASTVEYQARGAPHWNRLVKGVPQGHEWALALITDRVWCAEPDAEVQGQYVGEIGSAAAVTKYLASHFTKRAQWPPPGFQGQRSNQTKRYFGDRTRAEMRALAEGTLAAKRALYRALGEGLSGEAAEARARELVSDSSVEWELCRKTAGGLVVVGGARDRVREMRPPSLPAEQGGWLDTLFELARPAPADRHRPDELHSVRGA